MKMTPLLVLQLALIALTASQVPDEPNISVENGDIIFKLCLECDLKVTRATNASGTVVSMTESLMTLSQVNLIVNNVSAIFNEKIDTLKTTHDAQIGSLQDAFVALNTTQQVLAQQLASALTQLQQASTAQSDSTAEHSRALAAEASIVASLNLEITRATGIDASLGTSAGAVLNTLNSEITRALGADSSLAQGLGGEIVRASGVELSLGSSVIGEQVRAVGVEGSVAASVGAEMGRAMGVEQSVVASVSVERTRAVGVEGSLGASTANAQAAAAAEATRATAVEGSVAASMAVDRSRALSIEGSLATSVAVEATRAAAVETSVSNSLLMERNRAVAAEGA